MSWRNRLQKASFRGIEFHVNQATGSGGRNVVVHEYPLQEDHDTEDLGKKSGQFSFQAFLIGDDYDIARDTLIAALDQPSVATLVHPYLGSLSIRVVDYSWSITSRQGGYCSFNINYVKAGRGAPVFSANTADALVDAATQCLAQTTAQFVANFNTSGQPEFVRNSALDQLNTATDAIRKINGKINAAVAQVEDISSDIDDLGNELANLIQTPATLISTVAGVVSSFIGIASDIKTAFGVYDQLLAGFKITSPISRTAANGVATQNRAAMADNQELIGTALGSIAVVSMAQAIAADDVLFTSYDDAIAIRDALLAELDDQSAATTLSYSEYAAITELQTALYKRVEQLAPGLNKIEYIQRRTSLPALVIAHQVYGDATKADELVSRNSIANPLFMPAGKDIEVLK
jgi:prophage DNA circulation protein